MFVNETVYLDRHECEVPKWLYDRCEEYVGERSDIEIVTQGDLESICHAAYQKICKGNLFSRPAIDRAIASVIFVQEGQAFSCHD